MKLNRTQRQGEWKSIADTIDINFGKVATEVESLNYATRKNKGYFATGDALTQSVPTANVGEIAYVGTSSPFAIYKWENGWVDTGYEHTDSVELGDYVTKDDFSTAKSNLQEQINSSNEAINALQESAAKANESIESNKENISTLAKTVESNTKRIEELEKREPSVAVADQVYDGGRADTLYGGARHISGGGAQ